MGYPILGPYVLKSYELGAQTCGFNSSCTLSANTVKVVDVLFDPNTYISPFTPRYALSFFVQETIWANSFGAYGDIGLIDLNPQGIPIAYYGTTSSNPYLKYKSFANSGASVALTCPINRTSAEVPATFNFFVSADVNSDTGVVIPSAYEQYYSYTKFTLTSIEGLFKSKCYLGTECLGTFPSDSYNPNGLNFTLVVAQIQNDD